MQKSRVGFYYTCVTGAVAVFICLPLVAILYLAFFPNDAIWSHLFRTILPTYSLNTILLMAGTAIVSTILGTLSAWIVSVIDIPGRKVLQWALFFPFAMPAYVVAFVYTEFLEYAGPVQSIYRAIFGFTSPNQYYFPEIRNLGGAIYVLSVVFYPYVYMLARASFSQQSAAILEAGRVLGRTPMQCFWQLAIPLSRPAIMAGATLIMMETLNDFGTISLFGVHTLTSGIYDIWMGMNDVGSAAQLAIVMLSVVFILLYLESRARKTNTAFSSISLNRVAPLLKIGPVTTAFCVIFCYGLVILGFVLPAGILLDYSIRFFDIAYTDKFLSYAKNSLVMSLLAALLTVFFGVVLAYGLRISKSFLTKMLVRISCLGYATPGAILAVGIFIPFATFDNGLDAIMRDMFGIKTGLLLTGGMFVLVYGYAVRFLNIGFGSAESALDRITVSMDHAARVFGQNPLGVIKSVHLPLIRSGILAGGIIVFVDTMKELSATLLLRPFDFETLATYVYQYAGDERIEQASLGALLMVITGIIPVLILSFSLNKKS